MVPVPFVKGYDMMSSVAEFISTLFADWQMWSWLTFGVVLIILELLVIPGTYVLWFGLGAIATGILSKFVYLSVEGHIGFFTLFSAISFACGIFIVGKDKKTERVDNIGARKYIGQSFKVVEPIVDGIGKIGVGDTVWLAKSNKDIAKGTMVKVVDVKGTVLIVE